MDSHNNNRYAHIDAMRALAVMLVVSAHAGLGHIIPGGSGVTIFFSISGFIITYLMLREREVTGEFGIGAFYTRRVLKIGPPLIVCVIVPTLILAVIRPINWSPFSGILFFYFNWLQAADVAAPLSGTVVVWSLSIEEQFYLAFALIWLLTVKSGVRMRWLAVTAAVAAAASLATRIVLASCAGSYASRIYFGSDTRLDGIALGVLTAIAFHHSPQRSGRVQSLVQLCARDSALIAAVLLYLTSLAIRNDWFRDTFRFTFQAVAACIVILYGFGSRQSALRSGFNTVSRIRIIQFIGLASYSIYLMHLTAMGSMEHLVGVEFVRAIQVPSLIIVGACSGMLVYLCVERPVQRLRNRHESFMTSARTGL
jgi:peptidoglycan/LPS O-acetylase OafA/YrhL